ncbi:MAG: molybdopterin molybdenumtransferase MoeA [Kiritimatiellae bacterium]|nr:molybdopterin molybdenumtransferase MoeA [Kiritimatiellia bacterium]
MITVKEAECLITSNTPVFPAESIHVQAAIGQILSEDIKADRDLPPFHRVTMDGMAIHLPSWKNGQIDFQIESTAQAGHPQLTLIDQKKCIQVMTGAILPERTNGVIPYEELNIENTVATIKERFTLESMNYVHQKGSDKKQGGILIERGTRLLSPHIAILTSVGKADILVGRQPSVAIVSNGDEIVDLGQPLEQFQIHPSNAYALQATLQNSGYKKVEIFHYKDNEDEIERGLTTLLEKFEILILSGGVSMGQYDLIPKVLHKLDVRQVFHKVRQRPGKPLWFGISKNKKPVFGLPGNPVAALICFHRFVIPQLDRSMGAKDKMSRYIELGEAITFKPALTYFRPVKMKGLSSGISIAEPVKYNGSGDYAALGDSDGYIELPEEQNDFPCGMRVEFYEWRA